MSVQILGKGKKVALKRRHARLRKHISGTPELPRLVVTRSNRHMVAQIIDDTKGVTLVSESTLTSDFAGFEGTKTEAAKKVGELIAKKAQDAGITGGEAERTTTLVGLGHTVDGHHAIEHLVLVRFLTTVATLATTTLTALATTGLAVLVVGLSGSLSVLSFFSHLGFLFVVAHSARPPSRAPSATAATRP